MGSRFGDKPALDRFVLGLISLFGWSVLIGATILLLMLFGIPIG